uniref:Uncharacterized protein n=1 Tax=Arundo donax TaxID=35708 RepID=A0A0A8Z1Y1_ARUDO
MGGESPPRREGSRRPR